MDRTAWEREWTGQPGREIIIKMGQGQLCPVQAGREMDRTSGRETIIKMGQGQLCPVQAGRENYPMHLQASK